MDTLSFKTKSANKSTVEKKWYIVDAENMVVGRLASRVANVIRGKHKPSFTPHVDCGDKVVVINADKVRFTGKKMFQKEYIRHTGHPGGQRSITPREVVAKHPERLLENAVKGMLPNNRLRKVFMKNLHLYVGTDHPHSAQQPEKLEFK